MPPARPTPRDVLWPPRGLSGWGPAPAPRDAADTPAARERAATARRLGRRAPVGFGDPPRAEVRLGPVFLAGGVLAALLIFLLRSL